MPEFRLLRLLVAAAVLTATGPRAHAAEAWLTLNGAGSLAWGTSMQPVDAVPRDRSLPLPDAGFIGAQPSDHPDDLEVPGPHDHGERRFLRYANGELVAAWVLRPAPIDTTRVELQAQEQWRGAVLGPGDGRMSGVGDATSWTTGTRTVLHWSDRMSDTEILVVRAIPTSGYGVVRATRLEKRRPADRKAKLTGSLKDVAKPVAKELSGCLNNARPPVVATVSAVYDHLGRLGRVYAFVDQPVLNLKECVAGALVETAASPRFSGDLEIFRMR